MATRAAARGAASVVVLVSAAVMATPPVRGAPQDRQPPKATRLGPETPIADQVMGSAPGDQVAPLIAAGDGGSFAVWSDGRQFGGLGGLDGIFGSRLSTTGEVLDPMGIPISPPGQYSTFPALAWNGQDYLVAWEEIGAGIQAARVSPEGAMLDAHRITVAAESDDVFVGGAAVASTGGRSLVVWDQCRFGRGCRRSVRGAFVERDGSVGDSFRLLEGNRAAVAALAATQDGFLLTWEGGPCCHSNLFAMALDAEGAPLGEPIRLAKYVAQARLAASGGSYLVAWGQEFRNDFDVYGARLDPKGEVIGAHPIRIASNAGRHFPASVAPGPDAGWTVVWSGGPHDRIFGSRLSASGDVSNENGNLLVDQRGREGLAGIAFTGDGWTLVWDASYRGPAADVYAAAGELEELRAEEPRLVSQAPNSQGGPDIASNGAVALVVWSDARGTPRDPGVYASRMTLDGRMLDGSGIRLTPSGRGAAGGVGGVASDGTDFFVTWDYPDRRSESDGGNIYGTRVSSGGDVLDPNPIVVTQARFTQRSSDVAWTGDEYLVVWQAANDNYPHDSADVFGARVSSDGTVVDPHGIALADSGRSEVWPQITTGDDQLFLTWTDDCVVADGPSCTQDVSGARLDVGATRVGAPMSIAASDVWESQPTITAVPDGYLVGWSTVDYGTGESAVAVREVRRDGSMGSVHATLPTQTSQHFPHLAWDGDAAVLAWTLNGECFYCSEDAAVIRLDETGSPLDDAPTTVTATDRGEVATSVASIRPGCTAIGYGRGDDPTVGVGRGYLRLFGKC